MAFVNFYLIAGGAGSADINAGNTIGAAQATTTNGNWNAATGVFIAASGTPFASTVVGDYASVYIDGATIAVFVGKVTTVTSNVNITIDIATIKYGTAPTTSATARSCTINGSWNTEQPLTTVGLGAVTIPQSTKINIKGNLTTAATRSLVMIGTTTTPIWYSGYNTTPGDLDNDTTNSLAKPIWTIGATFALNTNAAYSIFSSLSVIGNRSAVVWNQTATPAIIIRCRAENISANAAAVAMVCNGAGAKYLYNWYKCPATATAVTTFGTSNTISIGCVATGGINSYSLGASTLTFTNCVSINAAGAGFLASTAQLQIFNCTVYGAATDGIKWTGTPSISSCIIGCLFSGLNGSTATTNGINNASGTNSGNVVMSNNDFYNVTNPMVGFGDTPTFFGQTDSNPAVVSASNMTPVGSSAAINNGFAGIFENQTFNGYTAIGAVDPQRTNGFFIQ